MIIKQYHNDLEHISMNKTCDSIRMKYFSSCIYIELTTYTVKCITCVTQAELKPPLKKTEVPLYHFAKIGLDLSGHYSPTFSGNKYIVSYVDLYYGWPKCGVYLVIEEIFLRFCCQREILTNNGTVNINQKVRSTLETMDVNIPLGNLLKPRKRYSGRENMRLLYCNITRLLLFFIYTRKRQRRNRKMC